MSSGADPMLALRTRCFAFCRGDGDGADGTSNDGSTGFVDDPMLALRGFRP